MKRGNFCHEENINVRYSHEGILEDHHFDHSCQKFAIVHTVRPPSPPLHGFTPDIGSSTGVKGGGTSGTGVRARCRHWCGVRSDFSPGQLRHVPKINHFIHPDI